MINKVLNYIKNNNMFEENDYVVAGVSGGADSVCLLLMLIEISKIIPINIHVVHINHMIRTDAGEDATYVQELCDKYSLDFTLVEKDVEAIAGKQRISTEEAGRNIRYEAFYKALNGKKGKIAIAHNKNDCCETFLFNLFRGSSLKGLSGIRPVRDVIVRPILCLERAEIEEYLDKRQIKYCIDSTNLEDNYTRNKIRHHILDTAVKDISSMSVSHISEACERINEAYELIQTLIEDGYNRCVTTEITKENDESYHIDKNEYEKLQTAIQGYVIMEVISRAAKSRKDIESVHIEQVKQLMDRQCGKSVDLPYSLIAQRDYAGICIKNKKEDVLKTDKEITLSESEKVQLNQGLVLGYEWDKETELIFSVIKADKLQNIPQKKYTKWFDYDKIKDNIVIRTRQKGDFLTINSGNQKKTLKSYFIDEKVPRQLRDSICLVAEGNHIIWVTNGRISNSYKIDENTKNILQIHFIDKNQGGIKDG